MQLSPTALLAALVLTATGCSAETATADAPAPAESENANANASANADAEGAAAATSCTGDCKGGSPAPSGAPSSSPANGPTLGGPAWLAKTWTRRIEGNSNFTDETYRLKPDGSGTLDIDVTRPLIPYGAGNTSDRFVRTWSGTNTVLTIQGTPYPIVASPNCRLLKIGSDAFESRFSVNADCPFAVPALTAEESALVGHWSFYAAGEGGYSSTSASLWIGEDRDLTMDYAPQTYWTEPSDPGWKVHLYFTLDATGMLRGVNVDGGEDLTMQITRANDTLTLCSGGCVTLTRK